MATEVVSTIRSSGGDYSSLSAWEAGEQADIVTADEYHIAECYDDWASGLDDTVTISGWTTDATRYIEIRPASGNRHDGTDPTSGFYLKQSGTATGHFHINQNYCTVRGCAVVVDAAYAGERIPFIITSGGPGRIFDGCIGTDPNSLNNSYTFTAKYAGSGSYDHTHNIFRNCLSYDNAAGFWANIKATCENCTAIGAGSGTGFNEDNTSSRSMIAKNCVAYNFGTNFNISGVTGCTNNAASDGSTTTPPGASPYTSDVVSGDFADAANDDYHLSSGSGLIGQGANLYSDFTTDIDGDTRPSSGAWDIGADHYAGGGGATAPTLSLPGVTNVQATQATPQVTLAF